MKDKAVTAYNLLMDGPAITELDVELTLRVSRIIKEARSIEEQVKTAQTLGLGKHLMAQSCIVNLLPHLKDLEAFCKNCQTQIAETQSDTN